MGDTSIVNDYTHTKMLADTLIRSPLETNKRHFPHELLGAWRTIANHQSWHRLEVLHGGLLLVQLASGLCVTGKLELYSDNKCSVQLDMGQPVTLTGTWCLWHGTLDFHFLGEYLIFMPLASTRQHVPTLLQPLHLA